MARGCELWSRIGCQSTTGSSSTLFCSADQLGLLSASSITVPRVRNTYTSVDKTCPWRGLFDHYQQPESFKRFDKMAYTISQLFHTAMFLTYAFTLYRSFALRIPIIVNMFKEFDPGQFKYLTIWDVIIQAVFFFICMLNDVFGTNAVSPKKPPFIRKLKDYVHAVLSFPVAMFVGITFWSLMFVDRELVFPKVLDAYFPWWLNHLMHTMIMVSTLMETILVPRTYPKRSKGLFGHFMFMFMYLVWIHIIYLKSGAWVYPVMEVLTLPLRLLFFLTLLSISVILYYVGETLDNLVWGNEYIKHQKSHVKSK